MVHFSQNMHYINVLWFKNYFIHILHFSFMYTCILMNFLQQYNNIYKFNSSIEIYPIDVNPIEVYPIEAYLIGKGAVEVSGCSPRLDITLVFRRWVFFSIF
jgi:hypothetical protein